MDNNDVSGTLRQPDRFLVLKRLGRRTGDWIFPALESFLGALPSLMMWLSIPLFLLCLGLVLQGGYSRGTSTDNSRALEKIEFTSEPEGSLVLFLSYPDKVFINPPGTPQQSISLWMQFSTPTPGPSLTPTSTRLIKRAMLTPTAADLTAQAIPPTQTPFPPHVVSLIVTEGELLFVDANDLSVPNRVFLTPDHRDVTPAVVYIRPQPGENHTTMLGVSVNNAELTKARVLQVGIEKTSTSYLRQLGNQIWGTPLFISALITALIGFAIQDWSKRNELWQRQQDEEKEVQKELNTLASKLRSEPSEGARFYLELLSRPDPKWQAPETRNRLEYEFKQRVKSRLLYVVAQLWSVEHDREKLENMLEALNIKHNELNDLLRQASKSRELDKDWQTKARVLAERVLSE